MNTQERPDIVINGKVYSMWQKFVHYKERWIGKKLQDLDGGISETIITDIGLEPNGKDSAMFLVSGKDFGCGFDVQYGGISGGDDSKWIEFHGYGGHRWRIER